MAKYRAYPEYKDAAVEWLDTIPSHWTTAPIKYMALGKESLFLDGDWIESKDISGDEIRYITTGNVGEGIYKEQGAGFISTEKFVELNCTEVFPGDILMSRLNAPIGRSCIVPDLQTRIVTSVDNVIFRPDGGYVKEFLVYLFSCADYFAHTANLARGATMQRISRGLLGNVRVIVPTFAEQTAIANFLDHETAKIDTLIEQQQQLIQLLKEKRQAVISHAVTKGLSSLNGGPNAAMKDCGVEWLGEVPAHWKVAGFKKYLESIVDYRGKTPEKVESGVFLVTARNIKNGIIDYSNSQEFVAESEYQEIMRRGVPEIGDVLFTTEAPLGEVAQIDNTGIALAQRIIKFRGMKDILDNTYLKFFINSLSFQQGLMTYATGSTALGIKSDRLGCLTQLLPPLSEQNEIVDFIKFQSDKMDGIINEAKNAILLMQERRTALISAAVTGKIDVRNWQAPQ